MNTSALPTLKQLAQDVSVKAGVWGTIPVPLERIADSLRYVTFSTNAEDDMAGAIDYDAREIYVNRNHCAVRQRFTLAHEIGHAVLHQGSKHIDYRRNFSSPDDAREVEANKFAAELLMPEGEFRDVWASRRADRARVGAYFGVSEDAAKYRAANLGLPDRYRF